MTQKVRIQAYPNEGEPDYAHLNPVVEFLIKNGNSSANEYIWGCNRTGYFCHLNRDINFDGLREVFIFPESVKLDEVNHSIDCFNTYSIIKKT